MSANPILIEVTRGGRVESQHRGAVAIRDADGRVVLSLGNTAAAVYPRSAVKVIQAIPLVTTGAAQACGFGDRELALAGASHGGEPVHTALAATMLARVGLDEAALECGAHAPSHEPSARALIKADIKPTALHNNCSGKHAGMLVVARHLGEPHAGYVRPDHPVQRRVAALMSELTGVTAGTEVCGIDGCSVPTWALPLDGLAAAFARMAAAGLGATEPLQAGARVMTAAMAEPYLVAGGKRFCTEVMAGLAGAAYVKTGAEGVFCAALPGDGLGLALKVEDGATRASEVVMASALAALLPGHEAVLAGRVRRPLRNVAGTVVGEVRPAPALVDALRPFGCA